MRGWRESAIRTEHYDRLAELRDLVRILSDSLSAHGVSQWLRARNRLLDRERPIDLLAAGEFDRVRQAATRSSTVPTCEPFANGLRRSRPVGSRAGSGTRARTATNLSRAPTPPQPTAGITARADPACGTPRTRNRPRGPSCSATSSTTGSTRSRSVSVGQVTVDVTVLDLTDASVHERLDFTAGVDRR